MASELLCLVIPVGRESAVLIFLLLSSGIDPLLGPALHGTIIWLGLGLFSNSYVVWEGAVLRFLAASAVVVVLAARSRPIPPATRVFPCSLYSSLRLTQAPGCSGSWARVRPCFASWS